MDEERPDMDATDESRPGAGGSAPDAEPSRDTDDADPLADADTAPGGDPAEAMPVKAEPGERSRETSESGAPGIPPPVRDDRLTPEGLPPTTTTGDPDKDYRGPSVTDTAREQMRDEPALDEPGYADLGHAEDYDILRRED